MIFNYEPNRIEDKKNLIKVNMICPVCKGNFDIVILSSIVDPRQNFQCHNCLATFNYYSYQLLYSSYIMQRAETVKSTVEIVEKTTETMKEIKPLTKEINPQILTDINKIIPKQEITKTPEPPKPIDFSPPDTTRPPITMSEFNHIIDFEDIKTVLVDVVNNPKIVHVCLLGPAGQGKTVFLKVLEEYYGNKCIFISGQSVTKSGFTDKILKNPLLEAVLIDEIDKMEIVDQMPLLSIMSDNRVNEMKFRRDRSAEDLKLKIFASGNDYHKLYPALIDRFFFIHQEKYTADQFYRIGKQILHMKFKDKFSDELINYMIDKFYNSMKKVSMRDLVDKVAKICRPEKKSIDFYVDTLNKYTQ